MTEKELKKVRKLVLTLIQRKINGRPYVNIKAEAVACCGGWQLVIYDVPLFHDNDILAIIGICANCCVSFQLYLNEKRIVLL